MCERTTARLKSYAHYARYWDAERTAQRLESAYYSGYGSDHARDVLRTAYTHASERSRWELWLATQYRIVAHLVPIR